MHRLVVLGIAAAGLLAGCGGSSPSAPLGSVDRPLPAQHVTDNEGAATVAPSYGKLLARQSSKPRSRFTPCNLVTKSQARAILGTPLDEPTEAPLGPTCVYRSTDGRSFVSLAVTSQRFSDLERRGPGRRPMDVANRAAFCATRGQPAVNVALGSGRVLTVSAPCAIAKRFALAAVDHLNR